MPDRNDIDELADALAAVSDDAKQKLRWMFESIDQRYPAKVRDAMLDVMPALVREHGNQAAAVAADWYEGIRQRELGNGRRVKVEGGYPEDAVTRRVRSAMGHAFRGNSERALEVLETSLDKFVKQKGRDTITEQANRDGNLWARVPRGATTCGFCLMLASRGFAYSSEHAASRRQRDGNKYHGNCDCQPVPMFGDQPPVIDGYDPARLNEWYQQAREAVGDDSVAIADRMHEIAVRDKFDIPDGVNPEQHEIATAERLAVHGYDVRFNTVSNVPGVKNPDVTVNGELWEFKSPRGSSEKNTISEQFKSAKGQAENLVIDLARCGLPDVLVIEQAIWRFEGQKRFKKLILIDKAGNLTNLPTTE